MCEFNLDPNNSVYDFFEPSDGVYLSSETSNCYTITLPIVHEYYVMPAVTRVIFNDTTTIVMFDDGTKTVAKLGEGEKFDRYSGFMACVCKKLFGGTSTAKKLMNGLDVAKQREKKEKEVEERAAKNREREEREYKKAVARKARAIKIERDAFNLLEKSKEGKEDV